METYKCIKKSYSYTGKLILDKSITISYTKEKINIHVVDYIIKKEVTKRQLVKRYEKLIKFITFYLANDDDSGVAYQEALNEINKYKQIIRNKYRKYIKKNNIERIEKELAKYEELLKRKLMYLEKENKDIKESRRSK